MQVRYEASSDVQIMAFDAEIKRRHRLRDVRWSPREKHDSDSLYQTPHLQPAISASGLWQINPHSITAKFLGAIYSLLGLPVDLLL